MDEFSTKRMEKFAVAFVDVYEDKGALAAGTYAVHSICQSEFKLSSEFVRREFESRGYLFEED